MKGQNAMHGSGPAKLSTKHTAERLSMVKSPSNRNIPQGIVAFSKQEKHLASNRNIPQTKEAFHKQYKHLTSSIKA